MDLNRNPPAPESPEPTLERGDLLAERFRIVRYLAGGGMGEVYEAEDLELGERVALKTIRPAVAGDERAMRRFLRELQLARRVTHPNVCRSFDLVRDGASTSSEHPRITFVTMELLAGEPLSRRLAEKGRLSMEEARPIVEQVASALAAAHDAGVIHRDLKSANVLLVPSKRGERAVVTDFGLARLDAASRSLESGSSLTETVGIAGTPAYMAPEQLEGGEVTPATDVYSLGVVLYEMVTGAFPFHGDSLLAMAISRLRTEPLPPRAYAPELDERWEKAILRCLERDPAKRFPSCQALLGYLEGEEPPAALPRGSRGEAAQRRLTMLLAALALVAALGLAIFLTLQMTGPSSPDPPPEPTFEVPTLAILGFKDLSPERTEAELGPRFAAELARALGAAWPVLEAAEVASAKRRLELPESDGLAPDTLARLRRHLDADAVVLGAYLSEAGGERLRVDLRLQDARSGEVLLVLSETASAAEIERLAERAAEGLRDGLAAALR